jgi:hypothetical protein
MLNIIKNSLFILIPFWLIYFLFYYLDIKLSTYVIFPFVLLIFVLSIIFLSKYITFNENKFKNKNNLSTYSYLYYSIVIFLIISFSFIFIFDSFCKKTDLVFSIYYNEGATNNYLYFLSCFYYYIKILFPIVLVISTLIYRNKYRESLKSKRKKNR